MATRAFELRGSEKLTKLLNRIEAQIATRELMSQIGNLLMLRIKERTGEGKDVEGDLFLPYSAGHAKRRAGKGLPTNIVDLFFTGSMMSSMTFDVGRESVRLFFMPTVDKTGSSNPEKAYFLDQKRQFFAISSDEIAEIEELAGNYLEDLLSGNE